MGYNTELANRVREHLVTAGVKKITEQKMFSGLAFLVNGKMCINVSGDNLMCRFDPARQEKVAERPGFEPMIMKGRELAGYCYVTPEGFTSASNFDYWIKLCLDYNPVAKASKKAAKKK